MIAFKYMVLFGLVNVTFGFFKAGRGLPLQCLECSGEGENAREDCEKKIVSEVCEGNNMVCGVGHFKTEDGFEFHRGCITKKKFDKRKAQCEANSETCVVAMCKTSNCKPGLPSFGGILLVKGINFARDTACSLSYSTKNGASAGNCIVLLSRGTGGAVL